MNILLVITGAICWVLGLTGGILFYSIARPFFGTLVVDLTDPYKDIFTLELNDIPNIEKYGHVTLKVRLKDE